MLEKWELVIELHTSESERFEFELEAENREDAYNQAVIIGNDFVSFQYDNSFDWFIDYLEPK